MKKNVIALAVAAAAAAPLAAQADVTVGGSLQAEIQSMTSDAGADGMYLSTGGRGKIEIMATEDLGGGMKAIAKYGMNAGIDGDKVSKTNLTLSDSLGETIAHTEEKLALQRDAYVGLSGGFGTVLLGTMTNPYKGSTVGWDPLLETGGQARGQYGMSKLHNGYTGNAIAYANKFGMASVKAAIVVDESNDDASPDSVDGEHGMALSVNVPVGPVEIAVAHITLPAADVDGNNVDAAATKLGVKYAAGAMSVAAQFETVGGDISDTGNDEQYMYVNGTYTFGANTVLAAYGQQTEDQGGLVGDVNNTYMAVGISHGFSKKTNAYAGYMALDPDGDNNNTSGIVLGMRVNF